MKNKRTFYKVSVGDQFVSINESEVIGEIDPTKWAETIRMNNVKSIGRTDNSESNSIYASGKVFGTINQTSTVELATEVVAFDPKLLANLKGDVITTSGLIQSGAPTERPYFAYGFVEEFSDGGLRLNWYPKCQLVENTDDIATREESFSEQNDTLTIRAYPFDGASNIRNYIDNKVKPFPEGLTVDIFFAKPILTEAEFEGIQSEGA